jgi:hypothetical protein
MVGAGVGDDLQELEDPLDRLNGSGPSLRGLLGHDAAFHR